MFAKDSERGHPTTVGMQFWRLIVRISLPRLCYVSQKKETKIVVFENAMERGIGKIPTVVKL